MRQTRRRLIVTTLMMTAALSACAVNPVTGKREFSLVSESQEIAMGKQAAEEVGATMGLYDSPAAQKYVSDLGLKLAAKSERPNLPWSFQVVDDTAVNAFALPGGYIFITRGLMAHMNNEAQLAAVVGHEIGHVTAKHSVQQLSRAQVAQLGLVVGMVVSDTVAALGQASMQGLQLLMLKYGRDAERQADDLGFEYSTEGGYDVRAMPGVFATLKRVGEASGGGRLPNWMSSHPSPDERIERINKMIADKNPPPGKTNRDQYLALTNGMIYGANPRQGFFEGSTFKHPELKFQLTLPAGWKAQNLAQAVVAEAPSGKAGFQMTLTKETPAQALQEFKNNKAISGLEPAQVPMQGLDATSAKFLATTEGGQIAGLVTFVAYQGKTFQLLGLAPTDTFSASEAAFKQIQGSFKALTDPAALNVQPARVKLVTVPTATTFADFASRQGSSVPVETLAILNQVETGTRIEAGQKVKVVEGAVKAATVGNVASN
jgi:predicted Zn-dependent protease